MYVYFLQRIIINNFLSLFLEKDLLIQIITKLEGNHKIPLSVNILI